MHNFTNKIRALLQDEEGAALVEYGMLVGLIAITAIGAVTLVGTDITNAFRGIADRLSF